MERERERERERIRKVREELKKGEQKAEVKLRKRN